MLRGVDSKGSVILGITARELDGLLAGARCCFVTREPQAPGPHICPWFGETDQDLVAKLGEMYPEGAPQHVEDYRSQPRPGSYDDPGRLTWDYYDNLCRMAEQYGTREHARTAAHIERLRLQIVALRGERHVERVVPCPGCGEDYCMRRHDPAHRAEVDRAQVDREIDEIVAVMMGAENPETKADS